MKGLARRTFVVGLAATSALAFARSSAGPRVQLWATRSGLETLDGADGSGNPFATALVEAIADPALDLVGACTSIQTITERLSGGAMHPEVVGLEHAPPWRFSEQEGEKREALVMIFSDYSASDSAPQLPGAARDGARVSAAFRAAGFATRLEANPTRATLPSILAAFAGRSARADVAALYVTGHGVEHGGVQYVLFGDHDVAAGAAGLARAQRWDEVAPTARARKLNLTVWAGCRNDPFA